MNIELGSIDTGFDYAFFYEKYVFLGVYTSSFKQGF